MYDQNFYWGAGVVGGEGVIVKDARSGVVGEVIKESFQKHLKIWGR